jgi:plastocyanin
MRYLLLVALVTALVVPLAACGGDDGDNGATGDAAAQTIQISATDFQFEPADITADAGEISFELTNDGQSPHALEIEGNGVEEESDTIDAGDSTTLTVELDEGTYEIYCPVGDHRDRGMVGTLTVGAGGGSGGATTGGDTGETETDGGDTGETETGETETGGDTGLGY